MVRLPDSDLVLGELPSGPARPIMKFRKAHVPRSISRRRDLRDDI